MTWLGLDVGGTSCRYEWWPEGLHAGGQARGVQPAVHGVSAAAEALVATLATAAEVAVPDAAVVAMAGAGDPQVAADITERTTAGLMAAGIQTQVFVVGDVLAAAAAGLRDGPGVLVWSGTGSFAVARGASDELARVGGRGYLLGDQGSAYDFVRRAAAAVLLAVDELGPETELTNTLSRAFDAPSPQRLGAVLQQSEPGDVARHLPVVIEAAVRGDAVANEVLESGTEALALLAVAAARSADLDTRDLPVSIGGGVVVHVPAIAELLRQRLAALGLGPVTSVTERAAAAGAAWLAHGCHQGIEPQRSWVQHVAL